MDRPAQRVELGRVHCRVQIVMLVPSAYTFEVVEQLAPNFIICLLSDINFKLNMK